MVEAGTYYTTIPVDVGVNSESDPFDIDVVGWGWIPDTECVGWISPTELDIMATIDVEVDEETNSSSLISPGRRASGTAWPSLTWSWTDATTTRSTHSLASLAATCGLLRRSALGEITKVEMSLALIKSVELQCTP